MHRGKLWILFGVAGLAACGGGSEPLNTPAPTTVEKVASGGFEEPMDAVASLDGETFFFSAHALELDPANGRTRTGAPAIFSVPSAGGTPEKLFEGAPLQDPSGLVLSCDGTTLYIADMGTREGDFDEDLDDVATAPLYTMDVSAAGSAPAPLSAGGIVEAASLAFDTSCDFLYVSGYDAAGVATLFRVPAEGGTAEVIKAGAPLVSPSGVFVDTDDVAWVMEQRAENGNGALYAIELDGTTTAVVEDLKLSEPAGVSLTAQGRTAVIPSRDEDDKGQLVTVHIDTMEQTVVAPAEDMIEPAGIRTARNAPIMAVVDTDGDAIFAAK